MEESAICYIVLIVGKKTAHIPDFSEEEFVKGVFENYDKKGIGRQTKVKNKQD